MSDARIKLMETDIKVLRKENTELKEEIKGLKYQLSRSPELNKEPCERHYHYG